MRHIAQYVSQIPIATGAEDEQIESLVEQIFNIKKESHNADVTAIERQIDQLVYRLYGLAEEETRIYRRRSVN